MKSSSYLPFLLTLTTANAAALLPRSPQGPDSSPGEFIDPALSHSNPQNNNPPLPGPYTFGEAPTAIVNPIPLPSAPSGTNAPNYSIFPAPTPGTPIASAAASASASSDAAALKSALDALVNSTTYLANQTYPYYYDPYYNSTYHHRHNYYNSSYWNSSAYLNITEYYNASTNVVSVVYGQPNGTSTTDYYNVTDPYGLGVGYGYNGSGSGLYNATAGYNGTGFWADVVANLTDEAAVTATVTAVPIGTGTGAGAGMQVMPYKLAAKPGFTGPKKGKRGGRRWLSGVV